MGQQLFNDQVTAVIPTLTNIAGLKQVIGKLGASQLPIIIVDNRPDEIKREYVKTVKNLSYLPQSNNRGFAAAVNLGVKQARTEWILILNDDIELDTSNKQQATTFNNKHNVISQLVDTARKEKWVAVSPVLKKPTGEIENLGYRVLPIGKVELNYDPNRNSDKDLDGLTAACLLFKRKVFEELGGFDERFFAYLEDVDLFLQLKGKGYHFGVDTEQTVIHQHMATSKDMGSFKARQDLVNWWRIVWKHPKRLIFSPTLPAMLVERGRNVSGWLKA